MWIGDTDLSTLREKKLTQLRRDRVGFIFQAFNLIPTLSAIENITLPMRLAGQKPDQAWVDNVVDTVGLRTASGTVRRSSPVVSSSASQWRGRWRAGRRSSSPTSPPATSTPARAPRSSSFMRQAVREFGQTIVMVTHDPVAASYADRAVFLADGQHRGRAQRPHVRLGLRPHAHARSLNMLKLTLASIKGNKARFLLTARRRDPGRRLHGGHARAHRHDQAVVQRHRRQRLQVDRRRRAISKPV